MTRSMVCGELIRLYLEQAETALRSVAEIIAAELGHGFEQSHYTYVHQLANQLRAFREGKEVQGR